MTTTALASVRNSIAWTISDIRIMAWRNLLKYVRLPSLLVFSTVQPVMFVLLFAYVFGGAIDVGEISYIDFLLPGILVQSVIFGSTQTGVGLADDLSKGMVERFRSLPMARSAVLAGRILADTVRNLFVVILMIGVGAAIGFRFHAGVGPALLVPVLTVLFGMSFSWISALIGVTVRDVEAAQAGGFIWVFPLIFISSVFVPVDSMPGWLQTAADVNPITIIVNALRALSLGGELIGPIWKTLAWVAAIHLVFVPLAVARYRRTT